MESGPLVAEDALVVGDEFPLDAKLTVPLDGAKPVPGVVIVHGSGDSDMDGRIKGIAIYRDIAHGLAERGVAAIRYDKRTHKHSKNKSWTVHDVRSESMEDAIIAANTLRADPRIDPDRIFIIGHSQGGMLAPRIDAEGGDSAGIVIMAGSPRDVRDLMASQQNATLAEMTNPVLRLFQRLVGGLAMRRLHAGDNWPEAKAKSKKLMGIKGMAWYFNEWAAHPASGYLTALDKPVMVLRGERDVQTSQHEDFDAYRPLLAHNQLAVFKTYPRLNHLFMPVVAGTMRGALREYTVVQQVAPIVLDDIAEWILCDGR